MTEKIGCPICKHYQFGGLCTAFPKGIPLMFLSGQEGHTEKIEGQENDIVFEWIAPAEQKQRAIEAIARHKAQKETALQQKSLLTIDK
jgi:hypothetical protein